MSRVLYPLTRIFSRQYTTYNNPKIYNITSFKQFKCNKRIISLSSSCHRHMSTSSASPTSSQTQQNTIISSEFTKNRPIFKHYDGTIYKPSHDQSFSRLLHVYNDVPIQRRRARIYTAVTAILFSIEAFYTNFIIPPIFQDFFSDTRYDTRRQYFDFEVEKALLVTQIQQNEAEYINKLGGIDNLSIYTLDKTQRHLCQMVTLYDHNQITNTSLNDKNNNDTYIRDSNYMPTILTPEQQQLAYDVQNRANNMIINNMKDKNVSDENKAVLQHNNGNIDILADDNHHDAQQHV